MKGLTTVEKVRFRRFINEFSWKHPTSETLGTLFYRKCSNKSKTSTFETFENRRNAAMAIVKCWIWLIPFWPSVAFHIETSKTNTKQNKWLVSIWNATLVWNRWHKIPCHYLSFHSYTNIWNKVLKNETIKMCGKYSFKNLKWCSLFIMCTPAPPLL